MRISRRVQFLVLAMVLVSLVSTLAAQTTGTATATVTINDVALLAVNTATPPTFVVDDPADAGALPVITPAGTPTYLQYTVVVASGDTKKITAESDTTMLDGLKLHVWAATPTGTGGVGEPVPGGLKVDSLYVADSASDLITNITSSATGSGTTQGPAVYYTLSIDAASLGTMETTGATVFTITYSLVDG
jgi:hypothetical protein